MNRGLRRKRGIEAFGFGFPGYIDDASPASFDHLWQQRMRDFPVTRKVQGNRFIPIAVGSVHRQRPAATGVVDQDADLTHCADRTGRNLLLVIPWREAWAD